MPSYAPLEARASRPLIARLREDWRDKATGVVVTLSFELLIVLVLLSLNEWRQPNKVAPMATVTFDAREIPEVTRQPKATEKTESGRPAPQSPQPPQAQPSPTQAQFAPPQPQAAIIPVSPQDMHSFDLAQIPRQPSAPKAPLVGPAFTPSFGDSKRVGTAPNGEPMYAAAWYPHEPTDRELAGYLSTADPGWALITCKTVSDYRVENCVGLDEYPEGSHMLRAVLAAAWQFRVRPPRVNGVSQVGDWVRIRIDYDIKPANTYGDGGPK